MKKNKRIRDIMSTRLCTCTPTENVKDAARLMDSYDIGCVAVCTPDGCCTGIVTDRDLVIRCHSKDKDVKTTKINEVMSASPLKVSPDTDIEDAMKLMSEHRVRRLAVEENGRLVGMISIGDIARNCDCTEDIGICECSIADDTPTHCSCTQ